MKYRAACPHCASVFRLDDGQLAAAQGWVQCGVCGVAFDARLSLLLEDGSSLPKASDPGSPAPAAVSGTPPDATGANDAPNEFPAEPAMPEAVKAETPAAVDLPRGIREREDPLDLPSIILIDPNLPSYDEPGPMPVIRSELGGVASVASPASAPGPLSISPAPPPPLAARIEYAQPTPAMPRPTPRRRLGFRLAPWIGGIAAFLLVLTLLAQVVWFQRDTLATQFPQLRPAFVQACAQLGCTLSLPKRLDQIRIIGSDLTTEASGQLRLSLTLGNQAGHPMTWPVLVLTLTDQAGQPLARRSFAPSEYLADPDRIAAGMPPLSEQALTLPLAVRDLAPMGFDLRLTY